MTKKVLHLITRFLDGGAELTTENALDALMAAEEEYDLRLGTGVERNTDRVTALRRKGIESVTFRFIQHYDFLLAILAVFEVAWYLYREDVDLIHTHSTEAGIIGRLAATLARTQTVIHEIHGDPITTDRSPVLNTFLLFMERLVAPFTTTFIAKSANIRETYLQRGIGTASQYVIIHHGVDMRRYRSADAAVNDDDEVVFLFVGRLEDGKGLIDLLSAFEEIAPRHDTRLLIAGDGPLADELEDEIEHRKLEQSVELLGFRQDVPELMKGSDVLVLPSYREGTPRVITEALAAGLPVVATDIAGIPEQVTDGETGVLVSPGDTTALQTVLESLIDDPEMRTQLANADQSDLEKFSVDRSQAEIRRLYRDLFDDHSR